MDLKFKWNRMESFSALEMYNIIQAREAVFVVEQACAYQEADGADTQSWHLSVLLDGELAAYARVVDPGVKYCEPSIGRVMAVAQYRKLQIGRALVTEAIASSLEQASASGPRPISTSSMVRWGSCRWVRSTTRTASPTSRCSSRPLLWLRTDGAEYRRIAPFCDLIGDLTPPGAVVQPVAWGAASPA
ncbi:GNAT family N-acetyltransferase [Comamonas terrigena]|uniref:GNAT family N-acetyltransferase n=1 Tax=Comamonas terrigena TaxID=32013 RepID=UPI0028B1821D|nr:hypothetical protein [Comamonas terrigena]